MDYTVSEEVPEVPAEVPEMMAEAPVEMPAEAPAEMSEPPAEAPADMQPKPARAPRIRKVRVKPSAPREASPPPQPDHAFWADRLRTHQASDRAAKAERHGNLRRSRSAISRGSSSRRERGSRRTWSSDARWWRRPTTCSSRTTGMRCSRTSRTCSPDYAGRFWSGDW